MKVIDDHVVHIKSWCSCPSSLTHINHAMSYVHGLLPPPRCRHFQMSLAFGLQSRVATQGIPVLPGGPLQTSWDGIDNGCLFKNDYFPNGADQWTHTTPMPMVTKLPIQNGFAKGWHLLQLHGRFGLHHSHAQKVIFGLQWGHHSR